MQHDAGTLTAPDGLTIATRRWIPFGEPRAVVLIVHGLSEHSGRYAQLATHLLLEDIAVYAYDHRHHGRSEGSPRAYIDEFGTLVDDLGLVVDWVRAERPELPLFVFGHSMGGAVLARYVADHGAEGIAGLILSSPALRIPDDYMPFLRKFAPLMSRLVPRLPTSREDRAFLSRDPAVLRTWQADPLTYKGGLRARTGHQILLNTEDILDHANAFSAPMLFIHGTDDRITDPKGSRLLYERAPSPDKTFRKFQGGYHEVFNDLDRERALGELVEWVACRID